MIEYLLKKIKRLDSNTKEVLIKSSTSVIVQFLGIFSRLMTSIFLGRLLGPSGLGEINFINQFIIVLILFSVFGLDHIIIKQVSIGRSKENANMIGSNIYSALIISSIFSILIASVGVLFSKHIAESFSDINLTTAFIAAFIMIIPQTISIIFAAAINGFRKIWQSRFLKDSLTSLIVLFGVSVFYYLNIPVTIFKVILLYLLGRLISLIVSIIYWKKLFSPLFIKKFNGKSMLKTSLPLFLVAGTTVASSSIDVIMLGWLSDSYNVGLYSVASRLILFMGLFFQISNSALAPKIAALYSSNKRKEIQVMIQKVTLILIYLGIFSILLIVIFGEQILGIWGEEFENAYLLLLILSIGQFVNIATGSSALVLIMSGNEKILGKTSLLFIILNLLLNYILIIKYAEIGAAIATSITLLGENIVKVIIAKKRTGIITTPLIIK